jgi:hypothetical protein
MAHAPIGNRTVSILRQKYPNVVWYPQVAKFCWLHSHNMLLQTENIHPVYVVQSLNQDVNDPQCVGKNILRESFGTTGPFCSTAINRYLSKHAEPMVHYKTLLRDVDNASGLTEAEFTALLPAGAKGVGVAFTAAHYNCGHMKCIRYVQADQTWYALDSWLGEFITPLTTDAAWKEHTKNTSLSALLHADSFPWHQIGVPCPNYLQQQAVEIDNERPFDLDQPLIIHQRPIRQISDEYTTTEIAQHTETPSGPMLIDLIPPSNTSPAEPMQAENSPDLLNLPNPSNSAIEQPAAPYAHEPHALNQQQPDQTHCNPSSSSIAAANILTRNPAPRSVDIRHYFPPAAEDAPAEMQADNPMTAPTQTPQHFEPHPMQTIASTEREASASDTNSAIHHSAKPQIAFHSSSSKPQTCLRRDSQRRGATPHTCTNCHRRYSEPPKDSPHKCASSGCSYRRIQPWICATSSRGGCTHIQSDVSEHSWTANWA